MTEIHAAPPTDRRRAERGGVFRTGADWFYRGVRWIRSHLRSLPSALGVYLGLGLAACAAMLLAFAALVRLVAGGQAHLLEVQLLQWLRDRAGATGDVLALLGAVLGSGAALWIVLGLGSLYFLRSRHLYSLALLWLALLGARVLNQLLKTHFDRPRPQLHGPELTILGRSYDYPTSYSFPSGHALTAAVVFGTLAYLVVRLEPTVRLRRLTVAAAAAVVLLIGLSRVYLGVHYPSDVLAGYLVGATWSAVAVGAIELVRYFAEGRPEVERLERDLQRGLDPVRELAGGEGER